MIGQLARKHDEVNLNVVELSRVITDARKQENVADIRLRLEFNVKQDRPPAASLFPGTTPNP